MENRADLGRVPRGGGGKETSCFGDDIGRSCFGALKISYSKCCTAGALSTTFSPAQRMIGERAIREPVRTCFFLRKARPDHAVGKDENH